MLRKQLLVFLLLASWDWMATAGTRLLVQQSLWSVLLAATTTAMWWVCISFGGAIRFLPVAILAAGVGTWLGITWP